MAPTSNHFPPLDLPRGVTSNYVETADLTYHTLEAGYDSSRNKPLILCLHGFPELAYSWRKIMPLLAARGFYVVAYDQRGYGRTTGWDTRPFDEVDLSTFSFTRLVTDAVRLVSALGYTEVKCLLGHDFGGLGASMCALMRPDMFKRCLLFLVSSNSPVLTLRSVILMSHPFKGSPSLPFNTAHSSAEPTSPSKDIHAQLANLPEPRKHYKWYYSTAPAASEMDLPFDELHTFLRDYFHLKSADWAGNKPHALKEWSASELAKLPYYYMMPLHSSMQKAVSMSMEGENEDTVKEKMACWLPDRDLNVYVQEFTRTGFQGGLNWYRVTTAKDGLKDVELFAGKKIEVPCLFIAGCKDWGTYQEPGVIEGMGKQCVDFKGVKLIDGAGHWVQQEQPATVVEQVLAFVGDLDK